MPCIEPASKMNDKSAVTSILLHPIKNLRTGVPMHPGDLDRSLMKKIIKQANLTEDKFRTLL